MTDEELMRDDMLRSARRAVEDNARHSTDSLYMLLADWFPQASDELLEEVVGAVL